MRFRDRILWIWIIIIHNKNKVSNDVLPYQHFRKYFLRNSHQRETKCLKNKKKDRKNTLNNKLVTKNKNKLKISIQEHYLQNHHGNLLWNNINNNRIKVILFHKLKKLRIINLITPTSQFMTLYSIYLMMNQKMLKKKKKRKKI